MPKYALPCIVCGKELVNIDSRFDNDPEVATCFQAEGNYGSTVWSPHPRIGEKLEINVCDTCLCRAADVGRVIAYSDGPVKLRPVPWKAPEDRTNTLHKNEVLYGSVGEDEPFAPAYDGVDDHTREPKEKLGETLD